MIIHGEYGNRLFIYDGCVVSMMTTDEQWKDISGYDGDYQVSTFGNVRSLKRGCITMKQNISRAGYMMIMLCNHGKQRTHSVHRMVATEFIKNPHMYKTVNHLNSDKTDNGVDNLEWCTQGDNNRHSYKYGSRDYPTGKLDEGDILSIHALAMYYSNVVIGQMFGICPSHVHNITHGKKWNRVT